MKIMYCGYIDRLSIIALPVYYFGFCWLKDWF